jgi:hypothetical protein
MRSLLVQAGACREPRGRDVTVQVKMDRPNCPSMDRLDAVLEDIFEMEAAIKELKELVVSLPRKMAVEITSRDDRIAAARYLYWLRPEMPARAIAAGLLGEDIHRVLRLIGKGTTDIACEDCGCFVQFESRTRLQEVMRARRSLEKLPPGIIRIKCRECTEVEREENAKRSKEYFQEMRSRIEELRTMPYWEYLQTPEWKCRRNDHLKRAGYRCQVCNADSVLLDVHHRTYERRGSENHRDLIALCRTCHDLFHREGRLVK